MGSLSPLQKIFGFTKNEIRALLFLSCTFLAGLGLRWIQSNGLSDPSTRFDYSREDSLFAELSARTLVEPAPEDKKPRKKAKRQLTLHSLDINSASKDELMLLPGIGETYAERILIDRQDNGPFRSVEDLTRVKGIGKKTLSRIREYIRPVVPSSNNKKGKPDQPSNP